eukprot:783861-Heterocapsa_arctica.AAC.1
MAVLHASDDRLARLDHQVDLQVVSEPAHLGDLHGQVEVVLVQLDVDQSLLVVVELGKELALHEVDVVQE